MNFFPKKISFGLNFEKIKKSLSSQHIMAQTKMKQAKKTQLTYVVNTPGCCHVPCRRFPLQWLPRHLYVVGEGGEAEKGH